MHRFEDILRSIKPLDKKFLQRAQERLDSLTKPRGSLGRLEEIAAQIVAIREDLKPELEKKVIFTFAGDHGVTDEGVSAYPKEVTSQMVFNFLRGGAGINVLAKQAGADVVVIDIGVNYDFGCVDGLTRRKIVSGTRNMVKGPAMTHDEALQCIETGIELAYMYADRGYSLFGTGDMGIGNTTPSSAIIACISGLPVSEVTGKGTGIDEKTFQQKMNVIKKAIETNTPDPNKPLDVLAKIGGAEIGGIAGLCLGAASKRVPVLVDGFVSTAGALIAYEIEPAVKEYLIASHRSVEKGHQRMLGKMGLKTLLDLNLRLGEGTGASLGMLIVESALRIYNEMSTFAEAQVSGES
jgi:nicotinate-nucleotide--dimethylbenzimidazole phosphoribosyltransferase